MPAHALPIPSLPPQPADAQATDLEALLAAVERSLADLGESLRLRDAGGIDHHAQMLRRALECAVDGFTRAARRGGVPAPLRRRLVTAGGQVAAQRESLVRASVALDGAMDALLPSDQASVYGRLGRLEPGRTRV